MSLDQDLVKDDQERVIVVPHEIQQGTVELLQTRLQKVQALKVKAQRVKWIREHKCEVANEKAP